MANLFGIFGYFKENAGESPLVFHKSLFGDKINVFCQTFSNFAPLFSAFY